MLRKYNNQPLAILIRKSNGSLFIDLLILKPSGSSVVLNFININLPFKCCWQSLIVFPKVYFMIIVALSPSSMSLAVSVLNE